jgi:hypothetical protein
MCLNRTVLEDRQAFRKIIYIFQRFEAHRELFAQGALYDMD